jgi:N-acetylmuramic acid 6-phosphate etherase
MQMVNLDQLITEGANPATTAIDSMSTHEIVATINAEDARVASAVAAVSEEIAHLVDVVVSRLEDGGRLIYVGAGTSGRLGVLDAAECPPTFNTAPEQIVGVIAGGHAALTRAAEAVEDDPAQGKYDVAVLDVGPNDVVLGIAASGRTPYVLGAVAQAKQRGAFVAGLACTAPSPLADAVDWMIAPIVGPEVITGSTRMKAGTAQKLVLNTLTTATMIHLGKTFGNLMVDVQPTNAKLRQRAMRIVSLATGVDHHEAQHLLDIANGEVKTAIVVALAQTDVAHARQRLAASAGIVRQALNNS